MYHRIGNVQARGGEAIYRALVTVYEYSGDPENPLGDLAAIYSDDGTTPIEDSEVATNENGVYDYYVASGAYCEVVTYAGNTLARYIDIQFVAVSPAGFPAADVSIEDAGNYYVSNNVEGALQELGALISVIRALDVVFFFPGVPDDAQVFADIEFVRPVVFPQNLTGSAAKARVAATAETTLTLSKNGVPIGTLVWSAAGTVAAITFASAVTFAPGDYLSIENQPTADATLADIRFTVKATNG